MKTAILWSFALAAGAVMSAPFQPYNPYYHNALADIRLHVVDDRGDPVEGATVSATFYIADTKTETVKKVTDSRGVFEARHLCNWELNICVRKDGYYKTDFETKAFITLSKEEATKVRRWSNGTVDIPVVLKKMRNPVKMVRNGNAYSGVKYPALAEVKGFDLKKFDWCPPYGKGECADLQISTDYWRSKDDWFKVYDKTVITMTNGLDGAYFADVDSFSAMRHPYEANTNAVYGREFVFEYDRRSGKVEKEQAMPKGKCLVFRTRTKVDDEGRLVFAHYGVIGETLDPFVDLDVEVLFNPRPNDTNLEDARPW